MARKKKMRLCASVQKTFEEGFQEFVLDCKSRNLRQGTIIHYEVAIKQIGIGQLEMHSCKDTNKYKADTCNSCPENCLVNAL